MVGFVNKNMQDIDINSEIIKLYIKSYTPPKKKSIFVEVHFCNLLETFFG